MTNHLAARLRIMAASVALCALLGATLHPGRVAAADKPTAAKPTAGTHDAAACTVLAQSLAGHWPDPSTQVDLARWIPAGTVTLAAGPDGRVPLPATVPAHCELIGSLQQRSGEGGQHYAIRFHLRMPGDWNGRLVFQGGGGSNGALGDALGAYSPAATPALQSGYAVVSQDSGHDNVNNNDPMRNGVLVFGFDEPARANYGGASLPLVAQAARAAARQFFGTGPKYSYFVGCSKGGEEGMALAQRYPAEFDGIAANAPGFSLPRAAVAQAWDTQAIALAATAPITVATIAHAFSSADLALVRDAVLAACDDDDGLKDGIVGDFARCTPARVRPQLQARACSSGKQAGCLGATQVAALERLQGGAHDSQGHRLYADWAWDTGIAAPGWRAWKLGNENGPPPALNVVLGGASLAANFTTPPTVLPADPQAMLDYVMHFDFDRDAAKLYATNAQFPRSSWDDNSARSSDLTAFAKRKGRMIVVQGVSDPVFSIHDTLTWLGEVEQRSQGQAGAFVRVFPVPGMTHCGGGDATDQYDVLAPLVKWVEEGQAPDAMIARAGANSPWPGRTRPLCPFPEVARYQGSGSAEEAASFACR
jgi:feruloyl esterase